MIGLLIFTNVLLSSAIIFFLWKSKEISPKSKDAPPLVDIVAIQDILGLNYVESSNINRELKQRLGTISNELEALKTNINVIGELVKVNKALDKKEVNSIIKQAIEAAIQVTEDKVIYIEEQ